MKSLITSVFWPAWEWIRHPEMRWVFASYAESLAVQHSLDRRTVIQSPWYQTRWGNQVQLVDPDREDGVSQTPVADGCSRPPSGEAWTGKGGNRIVVDDPHSPAGVESDAVRRAGHRVLSAHARDAPRRQTPRRDRRRDAAPARGRPGGGRASRSATSICASRPSRRPARRSRFRGPVGS